jgi:divalent metal cation (Fe/Co/Zn/Cd) transporter
MNLSPSKKYPYGIEKVKNMVVLIPALLFLYFGFEIQYECIVKIY